MRRTLAQMREPVKTKACGAADFFLESPHTTSDWSGWVCCTQGGQTFKFGQVFELSFEGNPGVGGRGKAELRANKTLTLTFQFPLLPKQPASLLLGTPACVWRTLTARSHPPKCPCARAAACKIWALALLGRSRSSYTTGCLTLAFSPARPRPSKMRPKTPWPRRLRAQAQPRKQYSVSLSRMGL